MQAQISVIFPVGNREAYLAEALASVLAQTFAAFELLVVLDGVPPAVEAILQGFDDPRIRIIRLPTNLGISTARNAALATARAPYIAYMDSDDIALPERFERQYAFMQSHPEVTLCGSNWIKLMPDGRRLSMRYPETDGVIKSRLLLVDSAMHNPTVMVRSDFIHRHGLRFDPNYPRDQSHRFYVEMIRYGAVFHGLQEELLIYRRHATNVTQDQSGVDAEKTRVREAMLPLYFPELSGNEGRILLKGVCQEARMTLEEVCNFVTIANKALQETRVFHGEERSELRRILSFFLMRAMRSLNGVAEAPAGSA